MVEDLNHKVSVELTTGGPKGEEKDFNMTVYLDDDGADVFACDQCMAFLLMKLSESFSNLAKAGKQSTH
jgi:hypothetical protein